MSPVSPVKQTVFLLAELYSLIVEVLVNNGKASLYLHNTVLSPTETCPWLNGAGQNNKSKTACHIRLLQWLMTDFLILGRGIGDGQSDFAKHMCSRLIALCSARQKRLAARGYATDAG